MIPVFGASNSRLQPRTYTIVFVLSDFVALVLQAAGGGLVAGSGPLDQDTFDTGLSILRAGLAFHVAGMLAFVLLASDYGISVWRNRNSTAKQVDGDFLRLRETRTFRGFVLGMAFHPRAPFGQNFSTFSIGCYILLTISISSIYIVAVHLYSYLLPSRRAQHGPR